MKVQINFNLYPRDGYLFIEADGARIIGDSWPKVFEKVKAYRERQGIPVGNVEEEVISQACQRNPMFCTTETQQQKETTRKASLKGRVLAWLSRMVNRKEQQPLKFVDENESKERARICNTCPFNSPFVDGCSSCKAAVNSYRDALIGPERAKAPLKGCAILGEDIEVSSRIDETRVQNDELPNHCWRKTTL